MNVAYRVLPDKDYGNGCGLSARCSWSRSACPSPAWARSAAARHAPFSAWVRNAVAPAAYQILGSELASVQSMGSYACRNVVGTAHGNRRSGHAIANAIDIAASR